MSYEFSLFSDTRRTSLQLKHSFLACSMTLLRYPNIYWSPYCLLGASKIPNLLFKFIGFIGYSCIVQNLGVLWLWNTAHRRKRFEKNSHFLNLLNVQDKTFWDASMHSLVMLYTWGYCYNSYNRNWLCWQLIL